MRPSGARQGGWKKGFVKLIDSPRLKKCLLISGKEDENVLMLEYHGNMRLFSAYDQHITDTRATVTQGARLAGKPARPGDASTFTARHAAWAHVATRPCSSALARIGAASRGRVETR
jgi:hypothetical protein